ncbi:MAG TPA: ATP-dependent zinc metalloprotease FtsH [Bacteroidales bacterium]|nr:ATP-dependent zinc metalloprotease FtsH [Bacteroidales bacterium]HOU96284.1 ATP-dependent zinc metalloprotease FtsH [Bacteroidales bacterium]HQG36471.1 ATP-dependent zinc metalloprotease FtsH [Bacteroidales bacterium]HQG52550.1 ATP-dependent zinc metalloprotease FtsH [Bacteroidales bacterium]
MAEEKNNNNNQNQGKPNEKNQKPRFNSNWIFAIIALSIIFFQLLYGGKTVEKVNTGKLREMIYAHDIEKIVVVNKDHAEIYLTKEALESGRYEKVARNSNTSGLSTQKPHFIYTIGDLSRFETFLTETEKAAGYSDTEMIYPEYINRKNYFGELLGWLLPFIILLMLWFYIMRKMASGAASGAGGIFSVGKSKAQIFDKDTNVKVNFNDVAGLEEAKMEVMEIVDFLKNPKKYTQLGGKIPKGALLIGPPGTGKTLLAKAVAGEANVPFLSLSGSDFVEMFVGVGASRVRDLFKQAKEKAPCIVFIDEIDAVGRARGRNPNFGANDERENTLNQLLTEMDGFSTNSGVIILAATNRADILDRALLRPGRFDRQIYIELPDLKEREAIFKVHLRPLKLDKNIDISFLARQTPGFSGADIANVCNEAALIAARRNKTVVEKQDFIDAIDRIIGGLERKNKIISQDEKKRIAYHEAGHATVSWLLEHSSPLVKVTIIPRGKALGAAWYLPEERQLTTYEQIIDEMTSALGGRAAEQLVFGKISTGALSDLEKVTKQAYAMVTYFGMSDKLGNISFYDSTAQMEFNFTKPYSEKTAELIDEEVKVIVERSYQRAISVLKEHMDGLDKLAEILIEKEVIFSEDLERIFGKRKAETEKQGSNTEIKEEKTQGQITNVSPAAMSDEPKKRKEEEKKRVKAEIKKEEPEN